MSVTRLTVPPSSLPIATLAKMTGPCVPELSFVQPEGVVVVTESPSVKPAKTNSRSFGLTVAGRLNA